MIDHTSSPRLTGVLAAILLLSGCGDAAPGGSAVQGLRAPPMPEEAMSPEMVDYHPDLGITISEMMLHPSGVLWADDSVGTGDMLDVDMTATVHYTGWLPDGTEFDSSRGNNPFSFRVGAGEVIDAWDVGVIGMRTGGKRKLVIPPDLGYGSEGFSTIPGNAVLVFEIELIGIQP
ncbi:MAG TPA: FKBP-type peptidyl-prolyl cis-trans isomerase [Gemmatimonadales bacterium]|nr:FKBP-type peptidyl-prolyl cis-trans isomerase [Gemmatimonadales bacterium]